MRRIISYSTDEANLTYTFCTFFIVNWIKYAIVISKFSIVFLIMCMYTSNIPTNVRFSEGQRTSYPAIFKNNSPKQVGESLWGRAQPLSPHCVHPPPPLPPWSAKLYRWWLYGTQDIYTKKIFHFPYKGDIRRYLIHNTGGRLVNYIFWGTNKLYHLSRIDPSFPSYYYFLFFLQLHLQTFSMFSVATIFRLFLYFPLLCRTKWREQLLTTKEPQLIPALIH